MESKSEIRKRIRAAMKAAASTVSCCESIPSEAEVIWETVEGLDEFESARTILLYCALPDEVATAEFIARWNGRKRIAVPLVVGDNLVLKEYDPALMKPGYAGIMEPMEEARTVDPSEIELAFIPGVGFDRSGNRLGRGKGFYDRLLPSLNCPLIGVCRDFQIVEDGIPADPWDRKVDKVVTNINARNC
ncbi:MAG: 5-formyltetrahydrofolate cyclo-ligase [Bacteroidales bacterium]|nr:5-formyltetrahydrofolate cyclo-ligase [Candidatus Cryptobacteroides caccocaballi]